MQGLGHGARQAVQTCAKIYNFSFAAFMDIHQKVIYILVSPGLHGQMNVVFLSCRS